MPTDATASLLAVLQSIAAHSQSTDSDISLRRHVAAALVEDRVPEDRRVPDPPLLRLETESSHAYLSILVHLLTVRAAPELCSQVGVYQQLVGLCRGVLERFAMGIPTDEQQQPPAVRQQPPKAGQLYPPPHAPNTSPPQATASHPRTGLTSLPPIALPTAEYSHMCPLVTSALCALGLLEPLMFQANLTTLFPTLTRLIKCEYATAEVHRALSNVLLKRVGPMLLPLGHTANGGAATADAQ